jgi:tetratricopeptide (TPR) repeat protein
MTLEETLSAAIHAAKDGQNARARQLFIEVLKQDQRQLIAWVWLSEVAEDLPHRIAALERALYLRPGDPLLLGRLDALRCQQEPSSAPLSPAPAAAPPAASKAEIIQVKLEQAHNMWQGGLSTQAVPILEEVVALDDHCEAAWLLLSEAYSDLGDRIRALEKAAEINPDNPDTQRCLVGLWDASSSPFKRGKYLEERGDFDAAVGTYTSIVTHSRSAVERVEATRRIEDIRLRQESDQLRLVNPTLNLVRLSAGPAVLFLLTLFIHSGLNLLHITLLGLLGLLCVSAGSLMVTITGMRPAHPLWMKQFGTPGTGDEPEMRQSVRLVGFALAMAPFIIFFLDAVARLVSFEIPIAAK